jgi:putative oxidoreductase
MKNTHKDIVSLVARIIIGGIFVMSGWMKIGGHDAIVATIGYFAQVGLPAFLVYVVGYLELIGGLMIVLGACACKAEGILSIIMLFAIWYSRSMGITGIMLPLITLGGLLALAAAGEGKYSVCPMARKGSSDMSTMA